MSRHEKEKAFQNHICTVLRERHGYPLLQTEHLDEYIDTASLLAFLRATQSTKLAELESLYGIDSGPEILRVLKETLRIRPLWRIIREGLDVRGIAFMLYAPKPRSGYSADAYEHYGYNRITYKDEFPIRGEGRIDIVLHLNGLPIITIELKHEDAGQNLHDAVEQYTARDQNDPIFWLPFLHIAADTSDVRVSTDPSRSENFRWFNTGLHNTPQSEGEYPVEFLYAEALSKDAILSYLSFYLIHAGEGRGYSIFPRYHQRRSTEKIASDILSRLEAGEKVGKNYLINHSAGSGKTLTISWMADRLHSLFGPRNEKALDLIFILTDRRDLDKNVGDELRNLHHLRSLIAFADKSRRLLSYIQEGKQIIVSTQHKLSHIVEDLQNDPALKNKKVAFLIDEAHRSQEGRMGADIRKPFRDEPDREEPSEEEIDEEKMEASIRNAQSDNLLFVAFTATPSRATVQLFGEPFDTYTEAEAIEEGYILDVAANVIAYDTLYHIDSKFAIKDTEERVWPKGVIAKALKNMAFADEGLIQYKAEVMLRIFEEDIAHLIEGKAKAMIVTSSRIAGLIYYEVLKIKLSERPLPFPCKVLYAFSDFVHPDTHKPITETEVNALNPGELIQDRFKGDEYRLLVVANKFQTGFDEPLLAGMFLDKPVADRNAVQTLSRLNRCADGKDQTVVVDFTNNTDAIFKAFNKYRTGSPYTHDEPKPDRLIETLDLIERYALFDEEQRNGVIEAFRDHNDGKLMELVSSLRAHFSVTLPSLEERKSYVYLLEKLSKQYTFLSMFILFDEAVIRWALFADIIAKHLIKQGTESELIHELKKVALSKAAVEYLGVKGLEPKKPKNQNGGGGGGGNPVPKASLTDMIDDLKKKYTISEDEAVVIREICDEKLGDENILTLIQANAADEDYLMGTFFDSLRDGINDSFEHRGYGVRIMDDIFYAEGAIIDTMTGIVIEHGRQHRRV